MDHPQPLAGLDLALVGAGRVGLSLASWARAAGATVAAVASPTAASRERATALLGAAWSGPPESLAAAIASRPVDVVLLAVRDAALAPLAAQLAGTILGDDRSTPSRGGSAAAVALHTAGALDAEVLAPLRGAGLAIGSWHPLHAFPTPLLDPELGRGIVYGVDGDPAALALAQRLSTALGGSAVSVPRAARLLYHFGATMAAGGVVGLLAAADQLARHLGLGPAVGRGYLALARGALARASEASEPTAAITGPLARGEAQLVLRQLDELGARAPQLVPLALSLAHVTLAALLTTPAESTGGAESPATTRLRRAAQESLSVELAARLRGLRIP